MKTSVPLSIAADHPAFAGHFPSRPIVPGVVLLDLGLRAIDAVHPLHAPYRLAQAKFVSIVGPGEPVRLEYDDASSDDWWPSIYAGDVGDERLAVTGVLRTTRAG